MNEYSPVCCSADEAEGAAQQNVELEVMSHALSCRRASRVVAYVEDLPEIPGAKR